MQSTVKGFMEKLTALLNKAALRGHRIDNSFREVTIKQELSSPVYLSEHEILEIYFYQDVAKKEAIVKDFFVLACLTGLRHSDFARLDKKHFINDNQIIRLKTKKTGKIVTIPVDKFVLDIMNKYDWKLPKCYCVQEFNKTLKGICQRIDTFAKDVLWERTVGLKVVSKTVKKYDLITTHTGRRSFATNIYKKNEFTTYDIMRMTGHSCEKTFYQYIRTTDEEVAMSMVNHPHFRRNC